VRPASWVGVLLIATVATIATVGFVRAARRDDAPMAAECADDWNARAGGTLRARVAAEGYSAAKVTGWFHDWPGCGIAFGQGETSAIVTCTRALDPSDPAYGHDAEWHCEPDFLQPGTETGEPDPIMKVSSNGTLGEPIG
jgi:hypothetical protein